YWCYDRHRSVRLVVLVGLAIDQIAQSGLSSLSVIYYSAHLFSGSTKNSEFIHQVSFEITHISQDTTARKLVYALFTADLNKD
ncbi:hypothetical protein, partial [Enterobacter asburiae]|uniref:hypothetical protein n=1 Tax=Enterobacter asburiae TaxID=61645 RepID=UPI001E3FA41D